MSIYWINVMEATHELSRWPLFISFIATVTFAITYVVCATNNNLSVCNIIAKALAYSVSILLVSSVVYVMSSPIN